MRFDTLIRGGRIIDGTRAPAFDADVGIRDGRIAAIGDLLGATADKVIEADGRTVAPGFIDPHTHYDVQLYWDPYCSTSGENGVTTVVTCNCGFGLAPCRPHDRDRYMRFMETTEEIPFQITSSQVPWTWESFPEYLDELRRMPKGVNITSFLPLNALLLYVMGDAAKQRRPTAAELQTMRELLVDAVRAGACGISMSHMGTGNNHTDADGSDMPSDILHPDDAVAICQALDRIGAGVIQCLSQIGTLGDRAISERLTRETTRPVLHNVFEATTRDPEAPARDHAWLAGLEAEGGEVYALSFMNRAWAEGSFRSLMVALSSDPGAREFLAAETDAAKLTLLADPAFRARWRASYDPENLIAAPIETLALSGDPGDPDLAPLVGRRLGDVAAEAGVHVIDAFADLALKAGLEVRLKSVVFNGAPPDPRLAAKLLAHPHVIPGNSDGGAHVKSTSMGNYTTDLLLWLTREAGLLSQEEMHHRMSLLPATAMGLADRGALKVGYAADILIYDLNALFFDQSGYELRHDLPGGDWRLAARSGGYAYTLVNGVVTHMDGAPTGATPGRYLRPDGARASAGLASA